MNDDQKKIGILGPWQTYSHAAARKYFGSDDRLECCQSIDAVFAGIITGSLQCGIVPIWNSTCGLVSDTAKSIVRRLAPPPGTCPATWWQCPLEVTDQIDLPIQHCLSGFGSRDSIAIVTSKIQAIDQCRGWLETHLGSAEIVPCDSTAGGMEQAKKDPAVAVIASESAAIESGVPIIERQIQDISDNRTEFLIIQKQNETSRQPPSSGDIEYWVGKEKDTTQVATENDNAIWRDQFVDFGQGFQFLKIHSKGGARPKLDDTTGKFQIRWPLGWAKNSTS